MVSLSSQKNPSLISNRAYLSLQTETRFRTMNQGLDWSLEPQHEQDGQNVAAAGGLHPILSAFAFW
jgi:hypothetical protein